MPQPSSPPGPTGHFCPSMISGGAPGCRLRHFVQLAEASFPTCTGSCPARSALGDQALRERTPPSLRSRRGSRGRACVGDQRTTVALRPMTAGSEVVEDYGHVGLTLRRHPVTFLRDDLAARGIVTCTKAMGARDGRWLEAAGLVLVRQRPGSAAA